MSKRYGTMKPGKAVGHIPEGHKMAHVKCPTCKGAGTVHSSDPDDLKRHALRRV